MTKKLEIEQKEIDAPYELPEGWKWYRGCELFSPMERTQPSGDFFNYIDIESVDNQNQTIRIPKKVATTEAPSRASRKLHVGDTVFSMVRPYLKNIAYIDASLSDSIASTGFYVCTPREFVDSRYIYNLMKSPYVVDSLNLFMKGDNSPSIRSNDIEQFLFPIPPTLEEQQRIVNRIESMFTKLDEAKEKAQNVVDSFETRKAAILHQAFTGTLTAKWRKENGISDDSWEEKTIGNCGSVFGGGTPSTSHKEYWENGNIPWITSKDMKSDLIEDSELHVNMNGIENSSAKYIDKPAVLFVMRSGILRRTFPVCMVKKEFTVNQDLKALVPNDSVILEYLFYACKSNERKILDTCMKSGTTVESINSDSLFNFMIKVPSLSEQQEIVRILDTVLEKDRTAKSAATQVLDQIDLLKKSILARAFRGKL